MWLTGLTALGGVGCIGFASFGGKLNPVTLALFYILFQVHAFRDEALFYRYYEAPTVGAGSRVRRNLLWIQVAGAGVLGLVLPAYVFYTRMVGYDETPAWLRSLPFSVLAREVAALETVIPRAWSDGVVLFLTGAPSIALIAVALARLRAAPGGLRGVWRVHSPLIKVLASSLALIFSSVLLGGGMFPLVILLHFVAWFQFTMVRLGRTAAAPGAVIAPHGLFEWMRHTRPGFVVLHGGLALLFLFLIAFNHWGLAYATIQWGAATVPNPLSLLLSVSAFYYWTIFHVTLSFMPKPAPASAIPISAAPVRSRDAALDAEVAQSIA